MKQRLTLLLFFLLVVLSHNLFAQGQGNIWYFGSYAGLDFNSGSPVVLYNSAMSAFEGCSSIADANGNLLFYTDGMTIWNKNHVTMYNGTGLYGNSSTTQSGVIVPQPGTTDIYYVFTCDAQLGTWGFRYSIVDMSQQSGLGAVTDKNIPIYTPATEKITATAKDFGEYWIMSHQWNNNTFAGYILNSSGLSSTATTSNSGTVMNGNNDNTIGYMKFSPDGNRIGYSIDYDLNRVELFDFDKTTGTVSNSLVLSTSVSGYGYYGFEFSPNSQVVYAANEGLSGPNSSHVYQWDLQAGTSSQIIASEVTMGSLSNAGALQLGPDGKIYLSETNTDFMAVVNDPDVVGTGCNYVQDAIDLTPGGSNYGLPNFVTSFFLQAAFTYDGICYGDSTKFSIVDTTGIDSVLWVFDDPLSGSDSSKDWAPSHIFSSADTFHVALYYYFQDTLDTSIVDVIIYPHPDTNIGSDTSICIGSTITLNATYPQANYLWMDGTTDSTHSASSPGLYYVQVTSLEGCTTNDTLLLTNWPLPIVDLGNDTLICDGQTLNLDVTNSGIIYLWQDGSTNPTYTVSSTGLYWAKVTDVHSCSNADSINVNYVPIPPLNLGNDTSICLDDTLTLNASYPGVTYQWSNGSTNSDLKVYTTGVYWAKITDVNHCVNIDTFNLAVLPPPPLVLYPEVHYCIGDVAVLDAGSSGAASYLWWDGTTNSSHVITTPGSYWVQTANSIGCNSFDTSQVFQEPLPYVNIGSDTLLCNNSTLLLDAKNDSSYHQWQDGSNTETFLVTKEGDYSVVVIDKYGCKSSDLIHVDMQRTPFVDLGPDGLYCYGDSIRLDATWPDATYEWNTGSTDPVYYVFMKPGTYSVNVTNLCGKYADSVTVDFHNCQSCVNVPNVFTPNKDGLNDMFLPLYDCNVGNYTFKIFDRWGQEIFESHNVADGWDGNYNGKPAMMDTYAWHLEYANMDKPDTQYELKGYVILLR